MVGCAMRVGGFVGIDEERCGGKTGETMRATLSASKVPQQGDLTVSSL